MKPSERIKEISEKIKVDFPNALLGNGIDAIINYLDEEYERNNRNCNCYCHQAKDGETYTTLGCIHCKGYEVRS